MYPAFNCSKGFIQHLRNLVVFIALEIKLEGNFEYFRQRMNSLVDILYRQRCFRGISGCVLVVV